MRDTGWPAALKEWRLPAIFLAACLLLWAGKTAQGAEGLIRNDLGMAFVRIPSGSFDMGSPAAEKYRRSSERLHRVTVSKPFYLQSTEVTLGQWRAVMGYRFFSRRKGADEQPVTRVSWHDCMDFIEELNKRGAGTYRLPTEAEWEYACRAGTSTAYWWGNEIDCSRAMYGNNRLKAEECREYAEKNGLPTDEPAPVKQYPPNPWGLYDMNGNVWEWCSDWYGPYPEGPVMDPQGAGEGPGRIRRGGSWYKHGDSCRCANRAYAHTASRFQTTGFRLVWDPPRSAK